LQPDHLRAGVSLQYDNRDLPKGPRAGGNYYAKYSHYWDRTLDRYNFNYLDTAAEHYIPYWNKTRVIALRIGAQFSWTAEGQFVPFYLQPTLGGTKFLRGFERYRFRDQNAILLSIEHRWHLYSGGFGALFFEAGDVASEPAELNLSEMEYSGGIGFRFTVRDEVVIRIDNAVSREGYRLIWTFSDLW
jgi:outer membrane protein assembly factor BamA